MKWRFFRVLRVSSTNLSTARRDKSGRCGRLAVAVILYTSLCRVFPVEKLFFRSFQSDLRL